MANPHKGEVVLNVGDESYTLSFSANAICELEDALDMSVSELGQLIQTPSRFRMKVVRAMLWAGLLDRQPGIDLKAASAIMAKLAPKDVVTPVLQAFVLALPADDAAAGPAGGDDARPPQPAQAAAGTG